MIIDIIYLEKRLKIGLEASPQLINFFCVAGVGFGQCLSVVTPRHNITEAWTTFIVNLKLGFPVVPRFRERSALYVKKFSCPAKHCTQYKSRQFKVIPFKEFGQPFVFVIR